MESKCELYGHEIKQLDKRVTKLEEQRERDKNQVHELDTSLQVFVTEMKSISEDLKVIANNAKDAVVRSTTTHDKEIKLLNDKIEKLEVKTNNLSTKLNNETIGADAEKWRKYSSYVLTALIAGIIAFLLSTIGLK